MAVINYKIVVMQSNFMSNHTAFNQIVTIHYSVSSLITIGAAKQLKGLLLQLTDDG